ncbi:MAG: MBL fold metallo-hydrolase [Endomicrobium sp.]|jgi:metallo-beta-lactamase family protein|nr:MBL fold metallo-hydrolase [Endomicrobium sp.]
MKKIVLAILLVFLSAIVGCTWVKVTPYGAAGTVTGSCFLLEIEGFKVIIDCGLFMPNEIENAELKNSKIEPELVNADVLVLTHAHLDHSGKIPLLIHKGFKGKIYSTQPTKELVLALFNDRNGYDLIERKWFWAERKKGKTQRNKWAIVAHWRNRCKWNMKSVRCLCNKILLKDLEKKENIKFLLCKNCCEEETATMERYFVTVNYNEYVKFSDNFKVKFINAGHIPGSASLIFEVDNKKILFSGDLGNGYSRFTGKFDIPEPVDCVFMEATCGGKKNKDIEEQYHVFRSDLKHAISSGKTIWIPALALNRTQKVLYELKLMQDNMDLSKDISIYSVSPSANTITALYQKEVKTGRGNWFLNDVYQKKSVLPENVKFEMIRNYDSQMIIFSASGDMDNGKSVQLMPEMLTKKNVFVMIVNYVDQESNAGLIIQNKKTRSGIKSVAKIKKYDVFSDHADFYVLQNWLSEQNKNVKICIIHAGEKNANDMLKLLQNDGWKNVESAKIGIKFEL